MRATGGGRMTRFRQVTSPASGLLRSLILDSVLFGNRLKSDRLLGADFKPAPTPRPGLDTRREGYNPLAASPWRDALQSSPGSRHHPPE